MKKLLVVMLVLSMASMANAALYISVNGTENPPDTSITLDPAGVLAPSTAIIDVWSDGATPQTDVWLFAEVMGESDMTGGVMLYTGDMSSWAQYRLGDESGVVEWLRLMSDNSGYDIDSAYYMGFFTNEPGNLPAGKLFDEITFTCLQAPGDVLLTLVNIYDDTAGNVTKLVYDTMIIHQIPEPMTLGLLGLGGLFLRRRK